MNHIGRIFLSVLAIISMMSTPLLAQNDEGSSWFTYSLIFTAALVFLGAVVVVAQSLVIAEAKRSGVDLQSDNTRLFAGLGQVFRTRFPNYLKGKNYTCLRMAMIFHW